MKNLIRVGCVVLSMSIWQLIWNNVLWRRQTNEEKAFRREQHSCSYRVGNGLAGLLGLCLADWLSEMLI